MKLTVSLPSVYSFASQVKQYPESGPKGISYFAGQVPEYETVVDCLLFRDKSGKVRGILNHYTKTIWEDSLTKLESEGNINIFVDPRFQRRGIGTKLLKEAEYRWRVNYEQQRYTKEGAEFMKRHLERKTFPPFERATWVKRGMTPEILAKGKGVSIEEAAKMLDELRDEERRHKKEIWVNPTYTVHRQEIGDIIYLSIKRNDKESIHDWRDLQQIKNALVGPQNEGLEIYPAEDRLTDTANQYHLWCFKDPAYRIPLGFHDGRNVSEKVFDGPFGQRPFGQATPQTQPSSPESAA